MANRLFKNKGLRRVIAGLVLSLLIGCSPFSSPSPNPSSETDSTSQLSQSLLLNMRKSAEQGKVINSDFAVKTAVLEDVKKKWGEPDKTDWVPAAKGTYVTYSDQALVVGFNKGMQIFEVRSFDQKLQKVSLAKTKEVYGAPAYDVKLNGEEIIGYTAGQEFKIELVFPEPTHNNPNPLLDHYLVLYPQGTVNSMANDPGRQW
ncbi:hypothetical protein DESME_03810 [Desulfitobacterium metallireducens DSM 15288]|uniref:DUF4309 domain-containing protein n=2 Tax=Desulfitobacterium TaxID=36853 RepID=W0EAP8_9FIRM|nr:YjgB family protein [Desulfitobacterium metallireducens]AHF06279.1 hypothetical protein DESME_03810 [Desulfitobacterium metallireducens DSM 15288]